MGSDHCTPFCVSIGHMFVENAAYDKIVSIELSGICVLQQRYMSMKIWQGFWGGSLGPACWEEIHAQKRKPTCVNHCIFLGTVEQKRQTHLFLRAHPLSQKKQRFFPGNRRSLKAFATRSAPSSRRGPRLCRWCRSFRTLYISVHAWNGGRRVLNFFEPCASFYTGAWSISKYLRNFFIFEWERMNVEWK